MPLSTAAPNVEELAVEEEEQLIAWLLFSRDERTIDRIRTTIQRSDFSDPFYGDVFQTMLALHDAGDLESRTNYLLVANALASNPIDAKRRPWQAKTTIARLVEVSDRMGEVMTFTSATKVAEVVKEKAQRRSIISAMRACIYANGELDFRNAVNECKARMSNITAPASEISTLWAALESWQDEAISDAQTGTAITTGWPTLDADLGPLRQREVVLIAARSGVGKTWAATSIAHQVISANLPTLFCTMEMGKEEIAERIVAQGYGVRPSHLRLSADGFPLNKVREDLPNLDRLRIYEKKLSIEGLRGLIKRAEIEGEKPAVVIIDYMGLIKWDGNRNAMQYERSSEIARELKEVAASMGVLIVCCVQLNREAGDGSEEPRMDMLRDSGSIEEAADRIIMLWKVGPGVAARLVKNRHGVTGRMIRLGYTDGMRLVEQR